MGSVALGWGRGYCEFSTTPIGHMLWRSFLVNAHKSFFCCAAVLGVDSWLMSLGVRLQLILYERSHLLRLWTIPEQIIHSFRMVFVTTSTSAVVYSATSSCSKLLVGIIQCRNFYMSTLTFRVHQRSFIHVFSGYWGRFLMCIWKGEVFRTDWEPARPIPVPSLLHPKWLNWVLIDHSHTLENLIIFHYHLKE